MPSPIMLHPRKARLLWLMAAALPLPAQAERQHSLSLDYQRSEQTLTVGKTPVDLDPAGWQLGYGLGLGKLSQRIAT